MNPAFLPKPCNLAYHSVEMRPWRFLIKSGVDSPAQFWLNARPFAGQFMYAVLETGSKQYRVAAGDTLEIERLAVEAGKPFTFDRVLLVNGDGKVTVGTPTVSGASVLADVVAHKRGEKKLTFKMKRRKGYHKTIGHRQELTVVKITEIKA
jgi:large subunit ribosomal protein L21